MNVTCARCGGPIERQRGPGAPRKYCATCSPKRFRPDSRDRTPKPVVLPTDDGGESRSDVYGATRLEVEQLGMSEHWLGVLSLVMASRLDNSANESGGAVASLVKAFRETLIEMRAAAPQTEESPLDALRRQRRERSQP